MRKSLGSVPFVIPGFGLVPAYIGQIIGVARELRMDRCLQTRPSLAFAMFTSVLPYFDSVRQFPASMAPLYVHDTAILPFDSPPRYSSLFTQHLRTRAPYFLDIPSSKKRRQSNRARTDSSMVTIFSFFATLHFYLLLFSRPPTHWTKKWIVDVFYSWFHDAARIGLSFHVSCRYAYCLRHSCFMPV